MEMFTAYPLCETLGMNQPPDRSYFNISKVLSLSVLNVQFNIIISAYNKAIIPRSYNIYVYALCVLNEYVYLYLYVQRQMLLSCLFSFEHRGETNTCTSVLFYQYF